MLDRVVDVFACGDGGLEFTNLLCCLRHFDKVAAEGDVAAQKIIDESFGKMVKLLDICKALFDKQVSGL